MMESWMISVGSIFITLIAGYAVMRNNVTKVMEVYKVQDEEIKELKKFMNENKPVLEHMSRVEEAYGKKIILQAEEIVELKTKISLSPTMEEVRVEFVSKEMFKQLEKHMDEKFDNLQGGIDKILDKLDRRDKQC